MSLGLFLLVGLGMVLVIEGLAFVLAPERLDELVRLVARLPVETRRLIGLTAMVTGAVLVSLAITLAGV